MFYIYIISSTIVALVLIGITYFIPLFLIREFDKITYIKNYKETMKWYKKPLPFVKELVTYATLLFSLLGLAIFVTSNSIVKKQFKEVFVIMFVTPLIGIGLSIVLAVGIDKILYILELHLISSVSNSIYYVVLFLIIPYYIVLIVKQLINLIKMENKQLEDYKELKEEEFKKKDWVAAILSSSRKEEYVDNYLQVYDTEEEWKESKFALMNYKWYYKLFFVIMTIGIIVNYVLSFIGNDLLGMDIITEQGFFLCIGLLIFVLGNWIFNEGIIYNVIKKIRLSKKMVLKLVILIVVSIVSTIIIWPIVFGGELIYKPEGYDYQEYKAEVVHNVQIRRNYLDYNSYEKQQYIFAYPQYFIDDISELDYLVREGSKTFCLPIENKEVINYFTTSINKVITLHIGRHGISISDDICSEIIDESSVSVDNNEEFYKYDSEEKAKEYEKEKYGRYKNLANNEIEKIMKEEAIKGIDKLWSEEMKDRGLE